MWVRVGLLHGSMDLTVSAYPSFTDSTHALWSQMKLFSPAQTSFRLGGDSRS